MKTTRLPGISPATLIANGIRDIAPDEAKTLIDQSVAGMLIPYHNLDGSESGFYRVRLATPKGDMKYTQKQGSGVHIYIPKGIERGIDTLGIVEGEKKALSLTEAGFPTLGISGFYGWQQNGQAHSELAEALAYLQPSKLEWIGDSDTLLNPDFYTATSRMVEKLPPFELVRMPYDGPKGADDMREALGEKFNEAWKALPRVTPDADEVTMLEKLLELQHTQIDLTETSNFGRFCKTLARFNGKPAFAMLEEKLKKLLKLKATVLAKGIKAAATQVKFGEETSAEAELVVQRSYTDGIKWLVDLNNDGDFKKLNTESWKNQLYYFGATPAQVSNAQATVEQNRMVSYAGPLCGRSVGHREEGDRKVLVTEGYRFRSGVARSGTNPEVFMRNLLGNTQLEYFVGWLKQARKALLNPSKNIPGQAVFFVGKPGCGKTLAQKVITQCLGGREADPQSWVKGLTTFNSDLWKAEHLTMSDATILDDWKARQRLTGSIKEIVANISVPLHAKYGEPLTLKPIWRFSGSANETPSSVRTLPSLDEDNEDKLLLFYTPKDAWDYQDGVDVWDLLEPDLDDFCAWVDAYEVNPDLLDSRFGIASYAHPEVRKMIHNESQESQLVGVLDVYFESNEGPLEGSAAGVYEVLREYASLNWIRSPMGLGRMLGKLATLDFGRYEVEQMRTHTDRKWTICKKVKNPF